MAEVNPPLVVKPVILKKLYRNGNPIPLMIRNGVIIYRCITKTQQS